MPDGASRKSILCVDDEPTGLLIRRMLLESQGYAVHTAENGTEALTRVASSAIDLAVVDYSMPGMMGDALAEKLKNIRPSLPVILLSAYVDLPCETSSFVDKSVTKGDPPQVLLDAIAELIGRY